MGVAIAVVAVVVAVAVAVWMLWAVIAKRGPWQTTSEDPDPHGGDVHSGDLFRRADRPAGPGAEDEYVGEAGDPAPAPPPVPGARLTSPAPPSQDPDRP